MKDVSVGFGGMVCLMCVSTAHLNVDFASGTRSLCLTERSIFNLFVQTNASSVDGDLAYGQAPIRPRYFWAIAGREGFA